MDSFELMNEYLKLVDVVNQFDGRLLQIKGWGVTFGLATVGLGFKEKARGLFLLAAISGICFWVIEAETKYHQTNYYLRMNEIEFSCAQKSKSKEDCPKIDWSWNQSRSLSTPFTERIGKDIKEKTPSVRLKWYIMPHVFIPHIFLVFLGIFFFRKKQYEKWVIN